MLPAMPATLWVWSEQVFLLTAAAALAALTVTHSKARLQMWQALLAVLLLLPAIEPWTSPPAEASLATANVTSFAIAGAAAPPQWHWRQQDWLWVFALGAAARLLWIAAGFLRLRRYRQLATPLARPPLPFAMDAARWYSSDSVPGPVTYGWRRPVILLPKKVLDLPADLREAIQCHELIHVRRGDWLFVLAEAVLRSVLWFHPAIWFVLGRIQLAREQAVDQEAVGLLQNRERYLDALVAVAGYRLQPDLAPAPLFLRKRHLAARVEAVVKEMNMSRSRIAAGIAAVCSAVSIAACAAMWLFPFVSEAQTAPDAPGVTVDAGGTLLHRAPVRTPAGWTTAATVTVDATLDAKGEVGDARVVSGPDELRRDALASVLQWHYQPGAARAMITIRYAAGAQPAAAIGDRVSLAVQGAKGGAQPATSAQSPSSQSGTIKSIQFIGISAEAEQELRQQLQMHEGDVISQADLLKQGGLVRAFDSHLAFTFAASGAQGATEYRVSVRVSPEAVPPPPPPPPPSGAQKVGAAVMSAKCISCPRPAYPAIAKNARIQGAVTLQATIGPDGTVQQLQIVSASSPLLAQAALDAVKTWVYQPTLLNGNPVSVVTEVTVNFALQDSTGTPDGAAAATGSPTPAGITNPRVTYTVEPQYTEEARQAKFQGEVLLSLVVDANGRPTNIHVIRSLGLGLDQRAVEALSQWRFEPGMKNGVPVAVQTQVSMTFRLL